MISSHPCNEYNYNKDNANKDNDNKDDNDNYDNKDNDNEDKDNKANDNEDKDNKDNDNEDKENEDNYYWPTSATTGILLLLLVNYCFYGHIIVTVGLLVQAYRCSTQKCKVHIAKHTCILSSGCHFF